MKLIFTTQGEDWDARMDPRFGRAPYFLVYDEDTGEMLTLEHAGAGNEAHGAGAKAARNLAESQAQILITGNGPGDLAAMVLQTIGAEIYVGAGGMTVREAYDAYRSGRLRRFVLT